MSGNCERGRGLRRREKNATEAGAGRYEKPTPDTRAAPPEAHESLIGRKTVEEVPLTGLSFGFCYTAIHCPADAVLLAYCCGGGKTGVLQDSRIRRIPHPASRIPHPALDPPRSGGAAAPPPRVIP